MNDGVVAFAFFTVQVPRADPMAHQADEAATDEGTEADTAYVSCTDEDTGTDTDEGTDEDTVAVPDTCWPDTDDGFLMASVV